MKIRIKGNMIRLRLTKPEVDYFGKEGYLEEQTEFGNGVFRYVLKKKKDIQHLSAEFSDGSIIVYFPENIAEEWTHTEKVGYADEMNIGDGKKLFLLVEKDYKCLDVVEEDQSDNYENPLAMKRPEVRL